MPSLQQIQLAIREYLNSNQTFENFSKEHIVTLIISFLAILIIPWYAKNHLKTKQQNQLGAIIGILITGTFIISQILIILGGNYDLKHDLPLQLCRFTNLAIVLVMVWRRFFWFEIFYFWAFAGMLQASFTPDLQHGAPHWYFWRYWLGHPGIILCVVYAVVVYGFKPSKKSMVKALIAMNVFMLCIIPFNYFLNANYLWICEKPSFKTIIDFCGPWPFYIVVLEFIAFVHFILAYLPFYVQEKRKKTNL